MNKRVRMLMIIAACEFVVATVFFVFPKSHIKIGDTDILFNKGVKVTVHKLLGCEFCNDEKWLQTSGNIDCWFGLRKTVWSPDFPGVYVFLDDNNPRRGFKDILNYYRKSADWTIVDDQKKNSFVGIWKKALDGDKQGENSSVDILKEDQKSSVSKKQSESTVRDSKKGKEHKDDAAVERYRKDLLGFMDMYSYTNYGDKSMRFTARRDGGEPNQYCRFCFKLAGNHIVWMEAKWTGKPKVPSLVEKAFSSVVVKVQ